MISALLAGAACWLGVPQPAGPRIRRLWRGQRQRATRPAADVVAAGLAPVAGLLLIGWPWGPVAGLAAAPWVRRIVRAGDQENRRRAELIERSLPTALDLVSAALSGGLPPGTALSVVGEAVGGPLGTELSDAAARLAVSGDLRSSLADLPESLDVLARALTRAEEGGAPIALVVGAAADDVRRDVRARRREAARRVGVRTAAPLGLCFLPAFLLIGIVPTVIAIAGTISL